MDVLTFETCSAVNGEIIKRVTSKIGLSLFNYQDDARSNKLKIYNNSTIKRAQVYSNYITFTMAVDPVNQYQKL